MFDQRNVGGKDLPKPAQWHRIAVHNETLGGYAVQQLAKRYISIYFVNHSDQVSPTSCLVIIIGALVQFFSLRRRRY